MTPTLKLGFEDHLIQTLGDPRGELGFKVRARKASHVGGESTSLIGAPRIVGAPHANR
jgi:hypothetical protein